MPVREEIAISFTIQSDDPYQVRATDMASPGRGRIELAVDDINRDRGAGVTLPRIRNERDRSVRDRLIAELHRSRDWIRGWISTGETARG